MILPILIYLAVLIPIGIYWYLAWFRGETLQRFFVRLYRRTVIFKIWGTWMESEGYVLFLRLLSSWFLLIMLSIAVVAILSFFGLIVIR
jgi:hypothetical protein